MSPGTFSLNDLMSSGSVSRMKLPVTSVPINERLPAPTVAMALGALALSVVAISARVGLAAPDDEEQIPPQALARNPNIGARTVDQWIFRRNGNATLAREEFEFQLTVQVEELERLYGLDEAQTAKLILAGRGDINRFFGQVEDVRRKTLDAGNDRVAFAEVWPEIQSLSVKRAVGLFGEGSLYAKTLRNVPTVEQSTKYQAVVEARRRARYSAAIEAVVSSLEKSTALRPEQRKALCNLLGERTKPPLVFGRNDFGFVMYRLAGFREKELKRLLDEDQWTLLRPKLLRANFRQPLIQNGVIAPEDDNQPTAADSGPATDD
jgi:hypothetical protein